MLLGINLTAAIRVHGVEPLSDLRINLLLAGVVGLYGSILLLLRWPWIRGLRGPWVSDRGRSSRGAGRVSLLRGSRISGWRRARLLGTWISGLRCTRISGWRSSWISGGGPRLRGSRVSSLRCSRL